MDTSVFYLLLRQHDYEMKWFVIDKFRTRDGAESEAKKRAGENPGEKYYVMESYSFAYRSPHSAELYRCQ